MPFVLFSTFAFICIIRLSSCSSVSLIYLESQDRPNGTDIPNNNNTTLAPVLTTNSIQTAKPTDESTIVNTVTTGTTTVAGTKGPKATTTTSTAKTQTKPVNTSNNVHFNTEDLNDKIDKKLEKTVWNPAEDNEPPELGERLMYQMMNRYYTEFVILLMVHQTMTNFILTNVVCIYNDALTY